MPLNTFSTFRGTGYHPNHEQDVLYKSTADIFSNITDFEIQQPALLIGRSIRQVGHA